MDLHLDRLHPGETSLPGMLYLGPTDLDFFGYTLEPHLDRLVEPAIPPGRYGVTVEPTHNGRLWTPYPDRCLPHLWGVPGRTGILIHAGNTSADTQGCIVVAWERGRDSVSRSRDAVKALVDKLRAVPEPHRITVVNPTTSPPPG